MLIVSGEILLDMQMHIRETGPHIAKPPRFHNSLHASSRVAAPGYRIHHFLSIRDWQRDSG